ncbi:uncharacterized protein LOC110631249 isoform X2 [Manihot esculenta]|uniref:uncharacterized protein LOC110631249 isoform X2 n=1 Tax=Manihot esculenta TaxID=3983 RepID=UPI001CC3F75E|nr:uncharacterized protein LOC110631249 isoform X2 [Manihot esculenta]
MATSSAATTAENSIDRSVNPLEDTSSSFYLHHSENHSSVIFTPKLTSSNFPWRRSFQLAVSIINKLRFLDGTTSKPSPTDPLYFPWIWDKLHQRFSQSDESRICHLRIKFTRSKGGVGNSGNFSKVASVQQISNVASSSNLKQAPVIISSSKITSHLQLFKEQVQRLMNLLSDQHVNQNPAPISDSQINTAGDDSASNINNTSVYAI